MLSSPVRGGQTARPPLMFTLFSLQVKGIILGFLPYKFRPCHTPRRNFTEHTLMLPRDHSRSYQHRCLLTLLAFLLCTCCATMTASSCRLYACSTQPLSPCVVPLAMSYSPPYWAQGNSGTSQGSGEAIHTEGLQVICNQMHSLCEHATNDESPTLEMSENSSGLLVA